MMAANDTTEPTCYIDGEGGADEPTVDGTSTRPYKTLAYAYLQNVDKLTKYYLVRTRDTNEHTSGQVVWEKPSKSAIKKAEGALEKFKKKLEKQQFVKDEQQRQHLQALEQAKGVVVKEDPSLPKPIRITIGRKDVELGDKDKKGARVKVYGRIHRLRPQKHATFITLTDGYGHLQCILEAGNLTKSRDALLFAQGTSLAMYGEMKKVPPGHSAPDDRELLVDYYEVIGSAPSDTESLTNRASALQD